MKTRIWFEGNRVGSWDIACAELCGLGHFRMKGLVTVDTPEDFQKWMAEQVSAQEAERQQAAPAPAPADTQASADGAKGGNS